MATLSQPVRRDFSRRSQEAELMDVEPVGADDFRACLADLATVNTLTRARPPTLAWLARATRGLDRFTLLDVGFGHGDMLRAIADWARRHGIDAELIGVDLNPWSAIAARAATPADLPIRFETGDVFAYRPDRPVDFIVSSLFTHHLPDDGVVAFLVWMEQAAARGWYINDLHRHALPYHGFKLLAKLAGWHRFVQHDGPVSIARSFRRSDWQRFVAAAGLAPDNVELRRHMPFRLCVGRLK